ncbi:MAG: ATP-dependent RNA helicase HrpA [Phycisphaerales bacterium]
MPQVRLNDTLPIAQKCAEIGALIHKHQVCVVCGETGSGKTTQLPLICLLEGRGAKGLIGHTQPRRIAARAVAARIAEELGESLGRTVGFKVRFGDQTTRDTRIKLMTDGILLAETQGDRELRAYDTIIIDEAHERSLNIDFLLGYLKQLLPRRPDLKVIVTSATIDPQRLSAHFGGPTVAPVIEVSGRLFPVELRYDAVDADEDELDKVEELAVVDAVDELTSPKLPPGDVLVFLPGEREIRQCAEALQREMRRDAEILPLFSRLSNDEQDRIFHPGDRRRVILATNVAETSLTVPGIRYVVDTGLVRMSRYDHRTKVQRLPIEAISQASANQRSGRCGRVAAGVCIRLYSEAAFSQRPKFTEPEVLRTSLASVILRAVSLRLGRVEDFPFIDKPDERMVRDGYETLFELGAIDAPSGEGSLTEIGARLARLPVEPRIGRMLLAAADEGALREVLVLAAVLSIQDPRERPMARAEQADAAQAAFRDEDSDFLTLLNIWEAYRDQAQRLTHGPLLGWCRERFLSPARMREWGETHAQLRDLVEDMELPVNRSPASADAIHRSLLTGLLSNVCTRDEASTSFEYQAPRGVKCHIFPGSVLFKKKPRWFIAGEIVETTKTYARTLAKIDPEWIECLSTHVLTRTHSDPHMNPETGEPSVWERVTLQGLVVAPRRRVPLARADKGAARELFIRKSLVAGAGEFGGNAPFAVHNRKMLESARAAEAKLRRRDVIASDEQLAAWWSKQLPEGVVDAATFDRWREEAERAGPEVLKLRPADVLGPDATTAGDATLYPDELMLGVYRCPLEYRLETGKETDGVTLAIPLLALAHLTAARAEWLVPGILPEKLAALLKMLAKPHRDRLAGADVGELARECAGVMTFGVGELGAALSEAIEVLRDVKVPPEAWAFKALADHLRLRVVVTDDAGQKLAGGRDVNEIRQKLDARLKRATAAAARTSFERDGLTAWDFDALPESVETEQGAQTVTAYPALVDRGQTVSLTLAETPERAAALTRLGTRGLFALACREELEHRFDALPGWDEMQKYFGALGTPAELRDQLALVIAERVFLSGQPAIRTRADFEERQSGGWGRLGQATMEVGGIVARILEPRFRVAHRLSGGTPRLWAASIADIREHAAYLMPKGFLAMVPWERLREYPKYSQAMRERLFKLREDGSGAETAALAQVSPPWKRFTGWVARAMSEERAAATQAGEAAVKCATGKGKNPLPAARRAAPTVNLDAGEWAMQPGRLPAEVEAYRWALEELRVALFAPEMGGATTVKKLDELWAKVEPGGKSR